MQGVHAKLASEGARAKGSLLQRSTAHVLKLVHMQLRVLLGREGHLPVIAEQHFELASLVEFGGGKLLQHISPTGV